MFTIIPVDVEGEEVMSLAKRFYVVVLVGLFLGVLSGGMMYFLTEVYSPLVCAIIVIFVMMGLNRFLHLDGLCDMGDGFLVLGDKERKLAVMKDSHIGSGGLAYGMLFVLLSVASLSSIGHSFYFIAPFATEVLIKTSMVACAASGEAREGLGGMFVKNTNSGTVVISALLALVFITPVFLLLAPDWMDIGEIALVIAICVLTALASGAIVARFAMKHFGIVNGDILGATNEISRPIVLLAFIGALWLVGLQL